jgi:hypothetical protein
MLNDGGFSFERGHPHRFFMFIRSTRGFGSNELKKKENNMTKLSATLPAFALLAAFALATPAFADDTPSGVASDVGAVQKDNNALGKDNSELAKDRAEKAQDKANGSWTGQAGDSMNIGADKTMKSEKETEKSVDQKTLNHDVNNAAKATTSPGQ